MKKQPAPLTLFSGLLLAVLVISGIAYAAAVPNFRITNINDINLGTWNFVSNMVGDDPVCVYKSSGNDRYDVTVTDTSTITPAQYRLQNAGNTVEIPYTISWSQTSAPGGVNLTDGTPRQRQNANQTSQTCGGGTVANFQITVTSGDLSGKPAGTYTTTLTMLIAP